MDLLEWIKNKNIPHIEYSNGLFAVDDNELRPYESELSVLFPEMQFKWKIKPYHHENPKGHINEEIEEE
jgi:hypothetical protein